jgi:type IV secretory pathway VirJ component
VHMLTAPLSVLFGLYAQMYASVPVHYGLFGDVHVAKPTGEAARTVVLVSDRDGWSARDEYYAQAFADDGALVLGIDLPVYLKQLNALEDKCSFPAGHFEEMSDWMQRHQSLSGFNYPLLVGDSAGASFAYALTVQAPAGTFAGLVTLGFDSGFRLSKALCKGDAGNAAVADGAGGFRIAPVAVLPGAWLPLPFLHGVRTSGYLGTLSRTLQSAEWLWPYALYASRDPAPRVVKRIRSWQEPAAAGAALPDDVADLPLVQEPHKGQFAHRIAIILTGDGGWAGLDIAIANQLTRRGIEVVGLNTLKFFWHRREPAEAADALTRIVGNYSKRFPDADFVVIGYSFGASLAPVVINLSPEEVQKKIRAQVLISPDPEAVFEVKVGDWFGGAHHEGTIPLIPEIARSKVLPICVHGRDEDDSFCVRIAGPKVHDVTLSGGHHYNGDYDKLADAILQAIAAGN